MIPFKASGTGFHSSQQPSPITPNNNHRYNINQQQKRINSNSLTINTGSTQALTNTNGSSNTTRHTGMNVYPPNGPITFRLTNV